MGADITTLLIGSLVVSVAALFVVMRRKTVRRSSGADDTAAVTTFTHALFAAQTSVQLRRVIAEHLPTLLGTRSAWVSTYVVGRRQFIAPEDQRGTPEQLLSGEFQEWTTVTLYAGREAVGLMGVDSETARRRRVRDVVRAIAPLIGQAIHNAHYVDSLREASLMDALTGAATRREGLARLNAELKRAQRTGTSMAVMLLDLDRFKSINDRSGHAMGDAVLSAVGQTLARTLRASDIRCRWGGEEFLVVLPEIDVQRAQVVATGLLRNIAATTVPTAHGPVGTTTSIGLTMTRPGEKDVEAIIHRADVALYRAKNGGRACVRVVLADDAEEQLEVIEEPKPTGTPTTLPFPDRRNPFRTDRRRIPGPGRRATDPRP
jgi:diguanylate cyclase (GGDEF)-like protein